MSNTHKSALSPWNPISRRYIIERTYGASSGSSYTFKSGAQFHRRIAHSSDLLLKTSFVQGRDYYSTADQVCY